VASPPTAYHFKIFPFYNQELTYLRLSNSDHFIPILHFLLVKPLLFVDSHLGELDSALFQRGNLVIVLEILVFMGMDLLFDPMTNWWGFFIDCGFEVL